MGAFEAVIFDMDGLMVDSEPIARAAWETYLAQHGQVLDQATVDAIFGMRLIDSAAVIQARFDLPRSPAQIAEVRDAIFFDLIEGRLKPRPGLFDLLDDLRGRPVWLGLATSGHREYTEVVLTTLDLKGTFDAVVTGDDVERGKPAPDIYRLAAKRLGLDPARCLVLEDAPHGVAAAKAAGMACIAVPNAMTKELDFSAADLKLPDLFAIRQHLTCVLDAPN